MMNQLEENQKIKFSGLTNTYREDKCDGFCKGCKIFNKIINKN